MERYYSGDIKEVNLLVAVTMKIIIVLTEH